MTRGADDITAVRPAAGDDAELLVRITAAGFYDDPVMGWVVPDSRSRLDKMTIMFGGLVTDMLERGTVHLLDGASTALWRDPDFDHVGAAAHDAEQAEEPGSDPGPFSADEAERLAIVGAAMLDAHPHEPHWYLNVVSTVPARQGQGLGARVIRPVLDICDAEGQRAYLESSNPRNISLYQRLGFVEAGEIPLPDGPSLTRMWRDPVS